MGKNKEAVGNLGAEEANFLKYVRKTRNDTRREVNDLFTVAHQNRDRDQKLMEKLFVQFPGVVTMTDSLLKNASTEQFEEFEKIKVAYNVWHFFESGAYMDSAQRRFPELMKVGKARPVVKLQKTTPPSATSGNVEAGATTSGANV